MWIDQMTNWLEIEKERAMRNPRDPFELGRAYALSQAEAQLQLITSIYGSYLIERSKCHEKIRDIHSGRFSRQPGRK